MNRLLASLSVLLLAAAVATPALADTYTYSYTGNDFTYVSVGNPAAGIYNPYTTSDSVTGSFTLSTALAPNLTLQSVSVASASLSDGAQTLSTNSGATSSIEVSTDLSGNIVMWAIELQDGGSQISTGDVLAYDLLDQMYEWFIGDQGTLIIPPGYGLYADNSLDPGTWTVTDNPDPAGTPEPSGLLLLGTSTLAGAATHRRRRLTT